MAEFRCKECKFVLFRSDKTYIRPEVVAYIYGNKCPRCGSNLLEDVEIPREVKNNSLKTVTVKLPEHTYNLLIEVAKREGESVATIIRSAIIFYLHKFYLKKSKIVRVLLER